MARSFLRVFVGLVLLAGFQHGTSGSEQPEDRQGALRLPDGSVLTPHGQGHSFAPQNPPGYSPAIVPYPYYPEPYPYVPEPYPYVPEPYPYIPEPYPYVPEQPVYYPNPLPPYHPPKPKSDLGRLLLLLYIFSGALKTVTTTTTTTASTAFPGTCQWGAWTTCSAICRGTRYRSRMCTGANQLDSELCNTETGFRPDGNWYRAANCYDYLWSTTTVNSKAAANTACTGLGARLASAGLRNDAVRTDVVSQFVIARGFGNIANAYVGISNAADPATYVWTDAFEGNPTFWKAGEPGGAGTACILLEKGSAFGLLDETCEVTTSSYLCERAAQ